MLAVKEALQPLVKQPSANGEPPQQEPSSDAPVAEPAPILPSPPAGVLAQLIASTSACLLRPLVFFPSWSGVLTLAWQGWPEALRTLKQDITANLSGLPKENPGSRWPKTSLGCVRDGRRLTPQQLATLQAICTEESGAFQQPQSRRSQAVLVDQLELVVYECRCLERFISKHTLHLKQEVDVSEPSRDEKERVQGVVNEVEDPDYWFHAARDGNRETHYRGSALGVTLVHELACFTGRPQPLSSTTLVKGGGMTSAPSSDAVASSTPAGKVAAPDVKQYSVALPAIIRAFRDKVDRELPGVYTWFDDQSLHITIRAVMG